MSAANSAEGCAGGPCGKTSVRGKTAACGEALARGKAAPSDGKDIRGLLASLRSPFFLAPLAGFTDSAFRYICSIHGAALCYTEMLSAKGLYYGSPGSEAILRYREGEAPLAIQIFGSEPEMMAFAAAKLRSMPNVIIDINMGCPVPKVVKNGEGSALLKDPALAADCVRAAAEAAGKPVTVKMRRAFSDRGEDASFDPAEFAVKMEEAGASAICVHGRTREQYYSGRADRESIRRVKQAVSVPVIGNGDVFSARDGISLMEETGCDAVMVARGAMGNPWLFEELEALWQGRELPDRPSPSQIVDTVRLHYKLLAEDKGEYTALREMRKHASFYTKGLRGASELRGRLNTASTEEELMEILDRINIDN